MILLSLLAPAVVVQALQQAAPPGAHVEVTAYRATRPCEPQQAEVRGRVDGSGTIALRVAGSGCSGWAFADSHVTVKVMVADKPLQAGEPISASVALRELRRGHETLIEVPEGAVAARAIARGEVIEPASIREPGLEPGQPVRVIVREGGLQLEQAGRALPCPRGRACALLPSGKRVEGRYDGGVLLVEAP